METDKQESVELALGRLSKTSHEFFVLFCFSSWFFWKKEINYCNEILCCILLSKVGKIKQKGNETFEDLRLPAASSCLWSSWPTASFSA